MLTDLKKCLMELRIQGTINDKYKKCAGYQFKLKIGEDDEIAEWSENEKAGNKGKIMKKVRFPLKFLYLSSNVLISSKYFQIILEVTPIVDAKLTQKALEKRLEFEEYSLCKL